MTIQQILERAENWQGTLPCPPVGVTVCGTGRRVTIEPPEEIKEHLIDTRLFLEEATKPSVIITGGAPGFDTILGIAAQQLRDFYRFPLHHILVRPFSGHIARNSPWYDRFMQTWTMADTHVTFGNPIQRDYLGRDQLMVSLASVNPGHCLAYWDGRETGGTWATMRMAAKSGLTIYGGAPGCQRDPILITC